MNSMLTRCQGCSIRDRFNAFFVGRKLTCRATRDGIELTTRT